MRWPVRHQHARQEVASVPAKCSEGKAYFEVHEVGGRRLRLCVHRKGATRAAYGRIAVRGASPRGLAEDAPAAYTDVYQVVAAAVAARLSRIVAKLIPLGVVKG
jgi:RNA-splicing ligase RtcB